MQKSEQKSYSEAYLSGRTALQARLALNSSQSGALVALHPTTTDDMREGWHASTVPDDNFLRTDYLKSDSLSRREHLNASLLKPGEEPPKKGIISIKTIVPKRAPPHRLPSLVSEVKFSGIEDAKDRTSSPQVSVSQLSRHDETPGEPAHTDEAGVTLKTGPDDTKPMEEGQAAEVTQWAQLSELLKRSLYDESAPENDDVMFHIKELRSRLFWSTDVPRYAAGCRKKFEKRMRAEAKLTGLEPVDMRLGAEEEETDEAHDKTSDTGKNDMRGYQAVVSKIRTVAFTRPDDGRYVYCLPRNRLGPGSGYDPYDLQVVSANEAKLARQHWTISASAVTRLWREGEGDCEEWRFSVMPTLQWLWERELFSRIRHLKVFSNFRRWKLFTIWGNNVHHKKNQASGAFLMRRLYFANEVLQGCLFHVQGLCEAAASSAGLSAPYHRGGPAPTPRPPNISLVTLKRGSPSTLGEFVSTQREQTQRGFVQVMALREKVVQFVYEACATVAEMEGITSGIRPETRRMRIIPESPAQLPPLSKPHSANKSEVQDETSTSEATPSLHPPTSAGKSSSKRTRDEYKPTHSERAHWKKILARLVEFLRLIDCQLLELFHRLVLNAVHDLDNVSEESWDVGVKLRKVAEAAPEAPIQTGSRPSTGEGAAEESTRKFKGRPQIPSMPVYVMPKFDLDAPPQEEKRIDIDELIRELRSRQEVAQIPSAVFTVDLVLNIPERISRERRSDKRSSMGGQSSIMTSGGRDIESARKSVSFMRKPRLQKDANSSDESDDAASDADQSDVGDLSDAYANESDGSSAGSLREAAGIQITINKRGSNATSDHTPLSRGGGGRSFVTLSPSPLEYHEEILGVIRNMEDTVGNIPSLLEEDRLSVFDPTKYDVKSEVPMELEELEDWELEVASAPWPDVDLIFGKDRRYKSLVERILARVDASFVGANRFMRDFKPFCRMVDQARKQADRIEAGKQPWGIDDFHALLHQYSEQVYSMEHMIESYRLDMLVVETSDFSSACLPHPGKVIEAVHQRLPAIANRKNESLLQIIRGSTKRLDFTPETVEDFVDHLSFLNKMSTELPALEKEFQEINRLFSVARDFDVPLEPESLALYKILGPSYQHLKNTITYHEAKKEEHLNKFTSDLETLITNMRARIIEIKEKIRDPSYLSLESSSSGILEQILSLQDEVAILSQRIRSYASYQERFGSSMQSSTRGRMINDRSMRSEGISAHTIQVELGELERDLTLRRLLWESQEEWVHLYDDWTLGPFEDINVEQLQKSVNKFTQTIYMLEKGLPPNEVVPMLKTAVIEFKTGMPVIVALRNPTLQQRHWEQIETIIQKSISREVAFTLGDLLNLKIFRHKDKIQEISATASNEATLETMLQKVKDQWNTTEFRLVVHADRETFIIAGADDLIAQLEESQIIIAMVKGSRYVTPIKTQVEEWERRLSLFYRTLEEWLSCQRLWLYLEQIFNTPDIQRQLPPEAKLFGDVDRAWHQIMKQVEDKPNALRSGTAQGVLQTLQSCNANLEKIQKSLEDYLETKRVIFPRFYFLSNEEVLEILSKSKDPEAVQPHLEKLFGNIRRLEINTPPRQPPTVLAMTSAEGETLPMPKNVRARGPVEQWLGSVEQGMNDTVKKHLKIGLVDYMTTPLQLWVMKHPGQVILTGTLIEFNRSVLASFASDSLRTGLEKLSDSMVETLNSLAGLVSRPQPNHKRLAIEAMLIVNVHNRDIANSLRTGGVTRADDFEWTRQIRYEWDESANNCNVMQSSATFVYGYEYLGCSPRLVLTPLTDRCYLTLTGALHLNLGGSPAGPAGTGKTETVKDLAKSVGKQCVVFNCSEGLDFKMLGKLFAGLVQSGSWCCFDEFNRIDIEVLSVVASQLYTIKMGKDGRLPRFLFEGREIKLNMTCGIFITMNPTYAGRVELPDNLKSLFRPVAMMVPDYALIAEILLFSEGFTSAKKLSQKIVNLYQLASRQLSQQDHYDFGMRAIKSVLVMAGHMRVAAQRTNPHVNESELLIQALRDSNLPRFVAEDVPIFDSIMSDLFPGMEIPTRDNPILEKAIEVAVSDQNLQLWPRQIEKVHQLHIQMMVRHGVMLVGPTGGGKTVVRNILQRALMMLPTVVVEEAIDEETKQIKQVFNIYRSKRAQVDAVTLNPKCVSMGELYGETDPNTLEWTDGLIAFITRKFAKMSSGPSGGRPEVPEGRVARRLSVASSMRRGSVRSRGSFDVTAGMDGDDDKGDDEHRDNKNWQWLVLDGPVDTIWVENLNTVLDDSKVLCLASGERISLTPSMRFLFEVGDLANASPATVSRCAMVFLDPVELGWRPYVHTWLATKMPQTLPESGRLHLAALLDHAVERGLAFVRQYRKHQPIAVPEMALVQSLCAMISAYLDFLANHGGFGRSDKDESGSRCSSEPSGKGSHDSKERRSGKKRGGRQEEDVAVKEESKDSKARPDGRQYHLQKNPKDLKPLLGKLFVFSFTWSFGASFSRVDDPDMDRPTDEGNVPMIDLAEEFDQLVHDIFDIEPPLGVRLPSSSRSIYAYFVDLDSGAFLPWENLVPSTKSLVDRGAVITIGETMGLGGGGGAGGHRSRSDRDFITTVDTVRYSFIISLHVTNGTPVLLVGEPGVGKSVIVKDTLKRLKEPGGASYKNETVLGSILNYSDRSKALLDSIHTLTRMDDDLVEVEEEDKTAKVSGVIGSNFEFSAQTSTQRVLQQVTSKMIKRGRETVGAPKGKKVVIFIDDLNMPTPDSFGTQAPIEFLRQLMDLHGFFDTTKLAWKGIVDSVVVGACAPVGGGRSAISPRLLKHFCLLTLPQPSTQSLQHVYQVQLGRFFQEGDFPSEVRSQLAPLVGCAIAVYYKMRFAMKPTPAKIHYTFNLRDVSKVIHGLFQAHEKVVVNRDQCAGLLAHEITRVFHDRLCTAEDRTEFYRILADDMHNYFKVRWTPEEMQTEAVVYGSFFEQSSGSTQKVYQPISDRNRLGNIMEDLYMKKNVEQKNVVQYVFFREAVDHIIRVVRVLNQPGGHMLLVGLDGTGKSSTVHLACFIAKANLHRLALTQGYSVSDFRTDLKKVYEEAGLAGKNVVFLLTDSDLVKEAFLEDINCVLNSGDVPDLFDHEELDSILMNLKKDASAAGVADNRDDYYQFFIERVNRNLHVILTLSPAGANFRQRCRANPALVNCCTIDWFDEWDEEAMLSVASVSFRDEEFLTQNQDLINRVSRVCVDIHRSAKQMANQFWEEMHRPYYLTPSSFIEFIKTFSQMLFENRGDALRNRDRLKTGLRQLMEANILVGTMREELVGLGPQIEQKAKETEQLLERLERDRSAVEEVRGLVLKEEAVMQAETAAVQAYAKQCEIDLASVVPALQQAVLALDMLDKNDISEVRVYNNPPSLVIMVMCAVCVLLQEKPSWQTAKMILGDPNFLKRLISYDKNNLSDKVFRRLQKLTKNPEFNPESMAHVSTACKSICEWVLALQHYNEVNKMVKPKEKRVEEAKEALKLAHESLAKKQERLTKIQDHMHKLQEKYKKSVDEREGLKQRKELTALRLQRAALLIQALESEKSRWEEGITKLDTVLEGILGVTLVSAGCVAYYGTLTARYRHKLLADWLKLSREGNISIAEDFDFVTSQVTANVLLDWHNNGLPRDPNSTENALVLKKSRRWSLMIDPQRQALNFLQGLEGNRLKQVSVSDPGFLQSLERSIRVGDPVVLLDVGERLDPTLGSILRGETYQMGGNTLIRVGDNEVEYNENFRFYLTTSLPNPHYLPSVSILVTIINFTVNFDGLQEQLLSSVVSKEKPDLESSRAQLLSSLANDMCMLRELEDRTLGLLQASTGHILDDEALPDTLERSKAMTREIGTRVEQTADTEKQLSQARQVYLPVATRGATLYFVLADLSGINLMYQFSLDWFQELFEDCVASTPPGEFLFERMRDMISRLTLKTYQVASAALFSHDQLVFSFLLCTSILRSREPKRMHSLTLEDKPKSGQGQADDVTATHDQGQADDVTATHDQYQVDDVTAIDEQSSSDDVTNDKVLFDDVTGREYLSQAEWNIFLHGPVLASLMDEGSRAKVDPEYKTSPPGWLSVDAWQQCQYAELCLPTSLKGFCASLRSNMVQWEELRQCESPYKRMETPWVATGDEEASDAALVFSWEQISSFERLLLGKILVPSKLLDTVRQFVIDQLGPEFLYSGQASIVDMFQQSLANRPVIFILAAGADPSTSLIRMAKELRGSTLHLDMVSLGRGQGIKAEELISKAQILKGRWIFLQNCHLAASWMPKLQQIVEGFNKASKMDPHFRLFLSAKPDSSFPISVLHAGVKMAVESPKGLKNILLRSFAADGTGLITPGRFNDVTPVQRQLFLALCLFNAVCLERSKYGTLGFNLVYEFNDSDLEVSLLQLEQLSTTGEVNWAAVHHLIGDITYGGRVTDDWDRRCLKALLAKYQNEEVMSHGHCFTTDGRLRTLEGGLLFDSVRTYLETLPETDSASAFGMGYNAEVASLESQARTLVDQVQGVQPRMAAAPTTGEEESGGPVKSSDGVVLDLVSEIQSRLPWQVEDLTEEDPDTIKKLGPRPRLTACMQEDLERVEKETAGSAKTTALSTSKKELKDVEDEENTKTTTAPKASELFFKSALHNVLRQEIDRYDHLLKMIHHSLRHLAAGIRGDEIMTEALDAIYSALLMNRVPSQWSRYASCKPLGDWTTDLLTRVDVLATWTERLVRAYQRFLIEIQPDPVDLKAARGPTSRPSGTKLAAMATGEGEGAPKEGSDGDIEKSIEPYAFWLPGFFFPQGFITGILQNQARRLGVSVDSLNLEFEVANQFFTSQEDLLDMTTTFPAKSMTFRPLPPPTDGALIFGLYVDNASWDLKSGRLVDSPPGRRFCKLPEIYFRALPQRASHADEEDLGQAVTITTGSSPAPNTFVCPLYRTSKRAGALSSTGHSTNFVCAIDLPSDQPSKYWVLKGTALLTQREIE